MTKNDAPLPVTSHLKELRLRAIVILIAIVVCAIAAAPFAPRLFQLLASPLTKVLPPGQTFVALTPFEAWYVYFKIALVAGLILSAPILLGQLFAFIAPAMGKTVRRRVLAAGLLAGACFLAGIAFCFVIVLPATCAWGVSFFTNGDVQLLPRMSLYVSFALRLLFVFGIAFELPLGLAIVVRFGIANTRLLTRGRPYVVVGAFLAAAILTPPDVFTQVALAIPLILLFEGGLLLGRLLRSRRGACPSTDHLL